MAEVQLQIPFAPDAIQVALMDRVRIDGPLTVFEGGDNYESMDLLIEPGFMRKTFCKAAARCHQFELTTAGKQFNIRS